MTFKFSYYTIKEKKKYYLIWEQDLHAYMTAETYQ